MKYQSVRGMEDILPRDIAIWQRLEEIARNVFESYGYVQIRTPILEETSLFVRSIGEATDIVTKEMYTLQDKKGRYLTLRPEGTAPVVRACIEHNLYKTQTEIKLYYMGPMFRSERPQKGRSRQFYQIGAEVIGNRSVFGDAEILSQVNKLLKSMRLKDFSIKLNTLGCKKDKAAFAAILKKYLSARKNRLCEDCKKRLKKNVLRVLDCKNEACIFVIKEAPDIRDSLCSDCVKYFKALTAILKALGVSFIEEKNLVRGLDYYTGTVFEISHHALGSQDAIGAGGRYNDLVHDLGGPDMGAVGYALGIERIILALKGQEKPLAQTETAEGDIYIATMGEAAKIRGMRIANDIRKDLKLRALTDTKEASLKAQMRNADRRGVRFTVILGDDEIKKREVIIRDMRTKEQINISESKITQTIQERMK